MINICIVEDDMEIGNAVHSFLKSRSDINVLGHFGSIEDIRQYHKKNNFKTDIILLDIVLPGISGIAGIKLLKEIWPEVDIIMFSVMDDGESIFRSLCDGAVGYITKDLSMEDIYIAVKDVSEGKGIMSPSIARKVAEHFHIKRKLENDLTPREMDIVHGMTEGLSYKLLAAKLNISIDTVRKHIKNIYRKLQINSKGQLISKFYSN
jgi:DNA-binding NarL/FixJ family response regulator